MNEDGPKKARIHTRVSAATKTAFESFLLRKHGVVHSVYGMEVALALNAYLAEKDHKHTGPRPPNTRPDSQTSATWRTILSNLETQESYPFVSITMLDKVIRGMCGFKDRRTIKKHRRSILKHATVATPPGEIFPKFDITGFAKYVREMAQ